MWRNLSKNEAARIFESWDKNSIPSENIHADYKELRKELLEAFNDSLISLGIDENQIKGNEYNFDLTYAIKVYSILSKKQFTERQASDDGIWRYLSIKLIPDITYKRWGFNPQRYYATPRRLWIKTLWWYIYLSWQGDAHNTYMTLRNNTTDELVQLVERSGPIGYRVNLCREIMRYYGRIPENQRRGAQLFRRVMKLNTARSKVVEPSLIHGGEKQYVKELFEYFD